MSFKAKRLFKKGNVLFKLTNKSFEGQESFSIILVLSDIYKKDDTFAADIQEFSVNTYKLNQQRNSLLFTPQSLWMRSRYADECENFFKLKDRNHFLKLAFDALFNRNDPY